MISIALLGKGTVGSGVVQILDENKDNIKEKIGKEINLKYILEREEYINSDQRIIYDFNKIIEDKDIKIVVEAIGGTNFSYKYVKEALLNKKSVVTSNKELVAEYGQELLEISKENGVNFLFGASVGGGIPLIRPINVSMNSDNILSIKGILNGTTNFILTEMFDKDTDFESTLKLAQDLGYAEKDPTADVEGHDACRKIAILLSIVNRKFCNYKDIPCKGISKISKKDIELAREGNLDIKLIGYGKMEDDGAYAFVNPVAMSHKHPLANVRDVFNGVMVEGEYTGDIMFYGKGAGKLPTASAVVSDIMDCVINNDKKIMANWDKGNLKVLALDNMEISEFIVFEDIDDINIIKNNDKFSECEFIENKNSLGLITPIMKVKDIDRLVKDIKGISRYPII